jgi:predicted PurR-regulated permease PerM
MEKNSLLDISWGTLLKISFLIVIFYILYQVKDILVWFLSAAIISIILNSPINFLRKLKIPRFIAVILVYVTLLGCFVVLVYFISPLFVGEIKKFSQNLPRYFEALSPFFNTLEINIFQDVETFVNTVGKSLEKITANILNSLFLVFGGVFAFIFILFSAIFLSLEEKWLEKTFALFFPPEYEDYSLSLARRCQKKVSSWFLSRIVACIFVGILTYLTLLIFNVDYPLSLGLLSALFNFIPVVGPLGMVFLFFTFIGPANLFKAVLVVIVFTLIQQIENNILTPILSKKFVDLSPVLVLLSLTIGGILFGFLGAILAVPLAGIISEFLKDFLRKKRQEEKQVLL